MELQKFLADNHHGICAQWSEAIIKTYPEEGGKFFSGSSNEFANPVGHTFRTNVERIYKVLISEADVSECSTDLDGILRIRAVQGFAPSVALCFLPALKEIVRRQLEKACTDAEADAMLHDWNIRVDRLTMLGFDLYMNCRELLWKQKANQLYSRTHKLLERANLLKDEEVAG
ncbi:MAG: hypothetical protein CVU60_09280 [Deltaproteobacteria bacterium HGW-Deltaproteobacteria-18]|jgi:hypothetical protein|nr:MAG: hypothetical protein CVU60_09280 [Deltaproteobacteria bacterium HGW-Deltaproteobacteria-18]